MSTATVRRVNVSECPHRPERAYCSVVPAIHGNPAAGRIVVVTCCDCGEVWERTMGISRRGSR